MVGLDEHTGIIMDCENKTCEVSGVSSISIVKRDSMEMYPAGTTFSLNELGQVTYPDPIEKGIRPDVWEMAVNAAKLDDDAPPDEALKLLEKRKDARTRKDFAESDNLRDQLAALGWTVQDSKEGQKLVKR